MSAELDSGILIIGITSTVLFDGGISTTELVLLDLEDGSDFTLPVSDEQAVIIANHISARESRSMQNVVDNPSEDSPPEMGTLPPKVKAVTESSGSNNDVSERGFEEVRASGKAEITPQF